MTNNKFYIGTEEFLFVTYTTSNLGKITWFMEIQNSQIFSNIFHCSFQIQMLAETLKMK